MVTKLSLMESFVALGSERLKQEQKRMAGGAIVIALPTHAKGRHMWATRGKLELKGSVSALPFFAFADTWWGWR